ncbi:small ribosomal subunit protein bS21c-like [Silene latifolia]|uniref:small ribosomal subunit protein bS21c-like n=1 Tax=Silene latifolia TaxID=37657 RepID=UPI003D788FA5
MASTSSLINFISPLFPSNTTPQLHPKFLHQNTIIPHSQNPSLSITTPQTQQNVPIIGKKDEYPSDVMQIVCPSLAYSNTLFFNSAYNVQVLVDDNEPEEKLLNRFRREVMRAGVIQECKRRRYFENKQDEKKRKSREAAKRNSRMRRGYQPRVPFPNKDEATKVQKKDDDEDNWEMPEGGSPF